MRIALMRSGGSAEDPYLSALYHLGTVCCIPTLSFNFININQLKDALDAHRQWDGVIFTSQRAVEAVNSVICKDQLQNWKSKPCFVVGEATQRAAVQAGFSCEGGDCGSASALGPMIKQFYNPEHNLPLLFICGQIRMNTLPEFMERNKIPFEEVVAYETIADVRLPSCVESFVEEHEVPTHIVYFSPSGYRFAHPIWQRFLGGQVDNVQLVAIGKTTAAEIMLANPMVRTAAKPTPASVYEVITS